MTRERRKRRRFASFVVGFATLTGCGGVPPTPEDFAATLPPEKPIGDFERERIAELLGRARVAIAERQLATAEAAILEALGIDPRNAMARALLGHCWMRIAAQESPPNYARMQRAEGQFLLATKLAPGDVGIALLRAELLSADHHLTAAIAVLEAVRARGRRNHEWLREMARLHFEIGEERAALPFWNDLAAAGAANPDDRYRIAWCQARIAATETDPAIAARAFRQAAGSFATYLVDRPDDVDARIGQAQALLGAAADPSAAGRRDLDAAIDVYERLCARAPASADAAYGAGVALERRAGEADAAAAIEHYRRTLVLDADHVAARLNLVAALEAAGRTAEARAHAVRALQGELTQAERDRLEQWLAATAIKRP
jgi:tetratricopeptide (TPR) repeat protein